MNPDSLNRVPSLAPGIRLYFDDQPRRWVIKAPQQVVFLDPLSLEVLRACDGVRNLAQIAVRMESCAEVPRRDWLDVVCDIVRHFEGRGMLRCLPGEPDRRLPVEAGRTTKAL
ncbi:hypothetical protein [Marinobacterium aestuariivivens]|uniref:Pyrroloquinoline quinone biosynthesis protein PqqD n=1 Tax=Marinobacterium aestuariivivens TaxID=1698799 RepID=A0ABW2A639_9GAMM